MGIEKKNCPLPKLNSNPASAHSTFSEEPGIVLVGVLLFPVELLNVLYSVNVLIAFSFSKSSRTEKWCQHAAYKALAFPDYISMLCNCKGRRIQILPVAFPLNIHDKLQKHVCPGDMSLDSSYFSVPSCFHVCSGRSPVLCFYSCSHIFIPCRLTCSRDGTRQTSEVKFKQDVQE